MKQSTKHLIWTVGILCAILLSALIAITMGQFSLSIREVLAVLLPGGLNGVEVTDNMVKTVWGIRLPRILLALLAGAGLSAAGAAFQALFSNPLATPDTLVFRPADTKETAACYIAALRHGLPAVMALTRQNLPQYAETSRDVERGAYILRDTAAGLPDVILMASGSEVSLAVEAMEKLKEKFKRGAKIVDI